MMVDEKTTQPPGDGDKILTAKISRSASFGVAATKIGIKHLGRLGNGKRVAHLSEEERGAEQTQYEHEIGQILFKALNQLKGTALKASQILSLEVDFLPKGVRDELAKACYQATPLNTALIFKVFRQEFGKSPHDLFDRFDDRAFAAASLGQVHLGEMPGGDKVAIKVQYPGIAASIKSDVKMIDSLLSVLSASTDIIPGRSVTRVVMDEIEHQLEREVDYEQEARNINWFRDNLKLPDLQLPHVIDDASTNRVLVMELLEGCHLDEWLLSAPNQTERDHYGQLLFDLFLHSVFELGYVHADPHPGNFLFMKNGELGLIDFGCVKKMPDDFTRQISSLYNSLIKHQSEQQHKNLRQIYLELGVIDESLTEKEFETELQPRINSMQRWMIEPFLADQFDFGQKCMMPRMDSDEAKKTMAYWKGVPRDILYFDRTYHGLIHMLKKLGARVRTKNPWIGTGAASHSGVAEV
jgi:predicted unusual protein kinase regulating ubiquinone biosynthesis (AarF/ABC1/UbiB family)